ncbi:MAG: hypothetical protein JNM36_18095, partial [Chitinophagales bacterium]|nr:hypothetical protein [Chitinophagales bacterium]
MAGIPTKVIYPMQAFLTKKRIKLFQKHSALPIMAKRYVLFGVGLDGGKPALFSYQLNRLRHIFVGLQLHYI